MERTLVCVERQIAAMTPEQLEDHPPGKWSAAGILEHLAITYDLTRRNLQKCLDTGARRATRPSARQRVAVLTIVELGRFPRGVEAPGRTVPTGLSGADALAAIRRNLPAMDATMAECEARFGRRRPVADHPLLGPLSFRQWRRFHWVHTRHHMRQIEERRQSIGRLDNREIG